jgi:hypothetical protein
MQIIGFCGFIGAGKSESARYVRDTYDFELMAFGDSLKDCVAAIYCWPRHLLDGNTEESRIFRDTVDVWWEKNLGIPKFTPRFALTNFGTDIMRNYCHKEIWTMTIERKILNASQGKIVFGDVRHADEFELINQLGGKVYRVKRGPNPEWFFMAESANKGNKIAMAYMKNLGIHKSEYEWIGQNIADTIPNDSTLRLLHNLIDAHCELGVYDL